MDTSASPIVVKVGGSLYDLPDLGRRLGSWLDRFRETPLIVVPGGGPLADAVRQLDRRHHLGEEASHVLALQTLSITGRFLAAILPGAALTTELHCCRSLGDDRRIPILDVYPLVADADLPPTWQLTSDSIAAWIAGRAEARSLVLLKSVTVPPGTDWTEAARRGWVDGCFPEMVKRTRVAVEVVNFREV